MTKPMQCCTAQYKIESIYVQTGLKGQGSPELALEIRKKERLTICDYLTSWFRHTIVFVRILGLD